MQDIKQTGIGESQLYYWGDIFITRWKSIRPNKHLVFIFHGFPAWNNKNYDVAERLVLLGYDVVLPHHRGLGLSLGDFMFQDCITQTEKLLEEIISQEKPEKISLVGHSWGGFVASSQSHFANTQLLLLAPLIITPEKEKLLPIIEGLFVEAKRDCRMYSPQSMARELDKLVTELNFTGLKSLQNLKTLIIHGRNDIVIPHTWSQQATSQLLSTNNSSVALQILEDDHSFTKDRYSLLKIVENWFSA